MLITSQAPPLAKSEELPNAFLDYYNKWFVFALKYSSALFEASYKGLETFLSAQEGPAQKIQNAIRASFDTTLRERLDEDSFATSVAEFLDSWVNLRRSSGLGQFGNIFSDYISYGNKILEPLRDNINRTPSEEIILEGRFNLLHYKSKLPPRQKTPILVIYSLINRHYILDLLPKVSVIRNLLDQGFDVYSTHWGTPTSFDKDLSLENYIEEYVEDAVAKIKEITGSETVSLFGYCWGGIFALIYSAIHPENVKSLILHATPIDIEKGKTVVENWTSQMNVDNLVEKCGNVPAWLLNLAFIMRNPVETLLKYPRYFSEPRSLDEITQFFSIETWLYDSRPIIGKVYQEIVNELYKKNSLIKNEMRVGPNLINLKNISMPLLDIIGTKDDLVPPESSKSIIDAVSSIDKKLIEFPTGHVGLCISTPAHEKLWPEVGKWLSLRS